MNAVATTKYDVFKEANPAVAAWLESHQLKSDFAASLLQQCRWKGQLSERQIGAVENCIRRDEQQKLRDQAVAAKAPVDIAKLEATFQVAKDHGINQPKLRLGLYLFKVASALGNNAGAIWVTLAAKNEFGEREYLGKIKDGRFQPSRACTAEQAAEIEDVAAHPAEAAKAYGQRTGMCCVCGRTLTKNESIDAMIGPICAEKYGF
jgi:hypothetical protein